MVTQRQGLFLLSLGQQLYTFISLQLFSTSTLSWSTICTHSLVFSSSLQAPWSTTFISLQLFSTSTLSWSTIVHILVFSSSLQAPFLGQQLYTFISLQLFSTSTVRTFWQQKHYNQTTQQSCCWIPTPINCVSNSNIYIPWLDTSQRHGKHLLLNL